MVIGTPVLSEENSKITWQSEVSEGSRSHSLWYRVDEEYADFVSERLDAALVGLLIPAMQAGKDIYLDGVVSERLYYNVSRPLQSVLQEIIPSLETIEIFPNAVEEAPDGADGVATGFSGGIDSFSVLADHHYANDVPSGFRLTHLLFNNVGSHGDGGEELFRKRLSRIQAVIDRTGLPLIVVNSNLHNFYGEFSYQQVHTLCNASVPLLLARGLDFFMYGSTYAYENVFVGPKLDIAYADPIILSMLSTKETNILSVGSEYTRVEKTLKVAGIEDSKNSLSVCVSTENPGENCSECRKCCRTLLTLEIAGLERTYDEDFDFEKYQDRRARYIARVLDKDSPFASEIRSFMEDRDFSVPPSAWAMLIANRVKNAVKRVLQAAETILSDLTSKVHSK